MKIRNILVPALLILFVILAACSSTEVIETETPISTETPTETVDVSEELSIDPNLIYDKEFQWISFIEPDFISQSIIENPENYRLVLRQDGTLTYTADCHTGEGNFTLIEENINIEIDATEITSCGEGSLANFYVGLLNQIKTFSLYKDQLSFAMENYVGGMGLIDVGYTE